MSGRGDSIPKRVTEASRFWQKKRVALEEVAKAALGHEDEYLCLLMGVLKTLGEVVREKLVSDFHYDPLLLAERGSGWIGPPVHATPRRKEEVDGLSRAFGEIAALHNTLAHLNNLRVPPKIAFDAFLRAAKGYPPYLQALQMTGIAPHPLREEATVQLAAWTRGRLSQRNKGLRETLAAIYPGVDFGTALASELPGAVSWAIAGRPSLEGVRNLPTAAANLISKDRADASEPNKAAHASLDAPLADHDGTATLGDMLADPKQPDPLQTFLAREEEQERSGRVSRFLDSLSPRERELFTLKGENLSDDDAAGIMGVLRPNIYNWRRRMKDKWEESA